jgi:hypothetical protein
MGMQFRSGVRRVNINACGTHWYDRRPARYRWLGRPVSGPGGHCIPNTPLGLLATSQSRRKRILGSAPSQTLGDQFSLRCLLSLYSRLRLGLRTLDSLQSFIFGQTLMGQLGLKIADRNLRIWQRSLSAFSRCCFGSDGLPSRVELVGAMFTVRLVIPANDGDRHFAVANKSAPLRLRTTDRGS